MKNIKYLISNRLVKGSTIHGGQRPKDIVTQNLYRIQGKNLRQVPLWQYTQKDLIHIFTHETAGVDHEAGFNLLLHNLKPIPKVQQICIDDSTSYIEVMTNVSSQDSMGCSAKMKQVVDLNGHLTMAPFIQHILPALSESGG